MCGICGIYSPTGAPDVALVSRMTQALAHRGPDGAGCFTDRQIALGHRRLSIIDLAGGSQPMSTQDATLTVTFNGEIYNYLELRAELSSTGYAFVTDSDTEVILHAYRAWGDDCVSRFNGMFAFALWDAPRSRLLIARDHLGIKPLYYSTTPAGFLFASEIKALLQAPECQRAVDVRALSDLFTFRYVPSPRTLFRGVTKLPPGHLMVVDTSGATVTRYWAPVKKVVTPSTENEAKEQYQKLLCDAVRLQLRSDVPVGLFLSSGVDSALLLALMSEYGSAPVHTYTIDFAGGGSGNESSGAASLAKAFGATHEYETIGPDDYSTYYKEYIWQLEEPVGNETAAAFYFVSRLTSRTVKVALSGQGADEPWAGYHRYLGARLSEHYSRLPRRLTDAVRTLVSRVPGRFERLQRGVVSLAEEDTLRRLSLAYSFFSDELKYELFTGELAAEFRTRGARDPGASLRHLHQEVQHLSPLEQMLHVDVRASLPDDLLMVGDKMSMANGLEARVPFLDYRLVEFVESLPAALKLNGFTGKYLHKKAAEKWLPRTVVWGKKKGFSNPVEHWFRSSLKGYVEELLLSRDAGVTEYFNQDVIRRMLDADRRGAAQYRRHLYLLLSFELWHRAFIRATPQR